MKKYRIGIDIGGTFTDGCMIDKEGQVWEAKAPSTPPFFFDGIIGCLGELGKQVGLGQRALLEQSEFFFNGTTIVTNTVVQLNGAKVGLITTKGFRDTLRIARIQKPAGETDITKCVPVPELVEFENTREIDERVMYGGEILVPPNPDQVKQIVAELVNNGVEAIAVVLLWSFENPVHEFEVKKIINELYPDVYVSISYEVHPVIREYERMLTTVLNAYVAPVVRKYITGLQSRLKGFGFDREIYLMHCGGGYLTSEEALKTPMRLLHSGPVGGVIGAGQMGKILQKPNIITADVGGTTFDTSLIYDFNYHQESRAKIGRFFTGLTYVFVSAIGAGGGSVAWLDARGALRLGPKSTGAVPGPACYDTGGTEPTLTDCCLLLGMLHPEHFLGGRLKLNPETAKRVVGKLAAKLGWTAEKTAAGVWRLLVTGAGEAIRDVSIRRGHEPGNFGMLAYGGASSLFAVDICREMGIRELVIPPLASVFSAFGLLMSDYKRQYVRSYNYRKGQGIGPVNEIYEDLKKNVRRDLKAVGFDDDHIKIVLEVDMRYIGQFFELTIPVDDKMLTETDFSDNIYRCFTETYEKAYGEETSWAGGETEIINLRVTGFGVNENVVIREFPLGEANSSACFKEKRKVFLPYEEHWAEIPVYAHEKIAPGMVIEGPAIIEHELTTIFLPPEAKSKMDQRKALVIEP